MYCLTISILFSIIYYKFKRRATIPVLVLMRLKIGGIQDEREQEH